MTDQDWETLERHVRLLCAELQLSDWTVSVSRDPCEDDTFAYIRPVYGQRHATLAVCSDFREVEEARAQKCLVHELLHCHWAGVQHHVRDDRFERLLGVPAYSMFRAGLDQHHENGIDAVSLVLAPRLTQLTWEKADA